MKILVINGPNLALLGQREPEVYGRLSLDDIVARVMARGAELGVEIETFQSDEEGVLVKRIGTSTAAGIDGIVINPAAYTHTSVALLDAIKACGLPCVEVHISNTHARESFRHTSLTAGVCLGQIMGFGACSYTLALDGLVNFLKERAKNEIAE